MPEPIGELLLDNARRAERVRWIMAGALLFCAAMLYWAADIHARYGLAPGDGGRLRPPGERLEMALLVALAGMLPPAGIWLYARRYPARIERRGALLRIHTPGAFTMRVREVAADRVIRVGFHDWPVTPGSSLSTPFLTLRIAGHALPYLVDLAAPVADRRAIEALAHGD